MSVKGCISSDVCFEAQALDLGKTQNTERLLIHLSALHRLYFPVFIGLKPFCCYNAKHRGKLQFL